MSAIQWCSLAGLLVYIYWLQSKARRNRKNNTSYNENTSN